MIKPRRWPHPGDTALDRARRVAWAYRQALRDLDPEQCDRIDANARALGETWVSPVESDADPNRWYTATEIAAILHIQAARVRKWGSSGAVPKLREGGSVLYRLGDCMDRLARARRLAKDQRDVHNAASG